MKLTMQIRPYNGSDEQALLNLWQMAMPYDRISARQFRTQVLLDPNFQRSKLLVATTNEKIVGFVLCLTRQVPLYLHGMDPEHAWITAFGVHPDYRRQGIGTALFTTLLELLRSEERVIVEIAPYVPNYFIPGIDVDAYPETIQFLEDRLEFRTLYHAISMGADLTNFQIPDDVHALMATRERNDGLSIGVVTSADIPELMPFIIEHFGWDWYRHVQSYLLAYFGGSSQQMCVLVARLNGEVVGFCQQREERFGPFGVRPDCRGKGIGKLLLFKCLERMNAKSVFYSYFLWTDERAARLYATAGYKKRRAFAVMRSKL